ncbi:Hypothetical protein R9X50_00715500 [Acrodontium crateriforme]|uniref:Zn(2)-C6 fungal-type domain-containing protein n=1 Tax=Acrodontium crateriforme TaxID=150365 RepID=A0AAQ3R7D2_9PEZI|nr:Hypothetical protein R9X50_00715500 [Acrodontium crateriforme]
MDGSPENNDSSPSASLTTNHTKALNKACEPCRASKLKCLIDPLLGDGRCKRCVATRRNCVFNAAQVRQRRTRMTDIRVAQLERQLQALRMKLESQQNGQCAKVSTFGSDGCTAATSSAPGWKFETPLTPGSWSGLKMTNQTTPKAPTIDFSSTVIDFSRGEIVEQSSVTTLDASDISGSTSNDVIARKVITWEHAEDLFNLFTSSFAPQYPFVTLPPQMRLQEVRQQRPATFLSILAATSSTSTPELNSQLNKELLNMFASRIILEQDRTLDLVQAMLIMAVWYSPSERLESLKHYQFAHHAATMAMDLGVADEPSDLNEPNAEPRQLDLDRRRTLLACYLLCTGISLAAGRPMMLHWTSFMEASAARLIAHPNAPLADQKLVAWVQLQRLAEKAVESFFSGQEALDISARDKQQKVTDYCDELDQWKRSLPFKIDGSLTIHYNQIRSRALCVCLYPDHSFHDFRPPFRIRHLDAEMPPPPKLTPFFARTVLGLVEALHDALESFVSMSTIDLLAAPVISYVRSCHALSVLLMLGMASIRPGNDIFKILDQPILKLDQYFTRIQEVVSSAIGPVGCKTPAKYLAIVKRMEDWWRAQNQKVPSQAYDLRPFMSVIPAKPQTVELVTAKPTIAQTSLGHSSSSTTNWDTSSSSYIISDSNLDVQFFPINPPGTLSDQAISLFNPWMLDPDQDVSGMPLPEIDWNMFDVEAISNNDELFE